MPLLPHPKGTTLRLFGTQAQDEKYYPFHIYSMGQAIGEEKDLLSNIIQRLNEKYCTDFSQSAKLAVEQVRINLKSDKDLEQKAKVNSYDVFKHAFEPNFLDSVIQEYDKNQEFYGKILQDQDFRGKLMDLIMLDVYGSFKENISNRIEYK